LELVEELVVEGADALEQQFCLLYRVFR